MRSLESVLLKQGGHQSPDDGLCAMEAVAWPKYNWSAAESAAWAAESAATENYVWGLALNVLDLALGVKA